MTPGGQNLSAFSYAYNAEGEITNWTEQADNNTPTVQVEEYDPVNQLISSTAHSGSIAGTILKQFIYQYDAAGNRTSEQIGSTGVSPAISSSTYNNVNQLTSRTGNSGQIRFRGSLNETGMVIVAGSPAIVTAGTNFAGNAIVNTGTNTVQVIASDYSGHSATNNYQIVVTNNGVAETLTYDPNGNLSSVVTATTTNTYQWDAENRLVSITSPTNQSLFACDGLGRRIQIIEKTNGIAYVTNKFVWDGMELCEQRNNTGSTVTKRFFEEGEQISGTNYFFTRDHLGSIREMIDSSGTIQARYDYDPYGCRTKIFGSLDADFGFAGYYYHLVSRLYLTLYRAYDYVLGRWLSRDPMAEQAGLNLYAYVENNPVNSTDQFGLCDDPPQDSWDWFQQFLRDHPLQKLEQPYDPFKNWPNINDIFNKGKNAVNDVNNILNHHFDNGVTLSWKPSIDYKYINWHNVEVTGGGASGTLRYKRFFVKGQIDVSENSKSGCSVTGRGGIGFKL